MVLLGIFLVISIFFNFLLYRKTYLRKIDGSIVVTLNDTGKRVFSLELDKSPDEIENMDTVLFSVQNNYFVE